MAAKIKRIWFSSYPDDQRLKGLIYYSDGSVAAMYFSASDYGPILAEHLNEFMGLVFDQLTNKQD